MDSKPAPALEMLPREELGKVGCAACGQTITQDGAVRFPTDPKVYPQVPAVCVCHGCMLLPPQDIAALLITSADLAIRFWQRVTDLSVEVVYATDWSALKEGCRRQALLDALERGDAAFVMAAQMDGRG